MNGARTGRYGSMTAVPTVSRWWSSRTAPQRIDLYTRWSFYGWIGGGLPLFTFAVLGSVAEVVSRAAVVAFLVGTAITTVLAVVLAARGLKAHRVGRGVSTVLVAAAFAAALATGAAGLWASAGDGEYTEGAPWALALPLGMVLTACSTVWATRRLVPPAAVIGVLGGGVAAFVEGAPLGPSAALGALLGVTVCAVVLAWRFSVWVLDVVLEMERTRGVQLQLAVAEERLRFSRDLHDVMGRNLSAIAVKSQLAGELVRRSRPEAADEVADISRLAEESLKEVREVVRGYRRTDLTGELAGARSVLRAAGVGCTVRGEDGAGTLPEPVQAALGWVVLEAVTNVLRHSEAGQCTIALERGNGEVRLTVSNDGVSGEAATGNGLTGLRERLSGAGGTLRAGRDGDRFTVTATVPTGGAA
ncbi:MULTISPECIES: sensor histidine kinase [unclassified Modestobacter]|uniref:sensor histidine kinase n=1 Tax=unclassified Modestobacter TaxID=2643866 RepID=UPI0022AB413F|nr:MULTISPECIES: histidine kinase [unclassified Modestobacter]MCZ2823346.1 histidine kinase [Modestobacter sp. VKM Ac-2981]MCZ2851591.1 histidine kinase [Modestobacter sp. VKM Ac-2982]